MNIYQRSILRKLAINERSLSAVSSVINEYIDRLSAAGAIIEDENMDDSHHSWTYRMPDRESEGVVASTCTIVVGISDEGKLFYEISTLADDAPPTTDYFNQNAYSYGFDYEINLKFVLRWLTDEIYRAETGQHKSLDWRSRYKFPKKY